MESTAEEAFDYEETELYYDQNSSNNTYQIKIWIDPNSGVPSSIPSAFEYIQHYEFRYVGQWPSLIGEANYYQSYDIQAVVTMLQPEFKVLELGGNADYSPK